MEKFMVYGKMSAINPIQDKTALGFFASARSFKDAGIHPYGMLFYKTYFDLSDKSLNVPLLKNSVLTSAKEGIFTDLNEIENKLTFCTKWFTAISRDYVYFNKNYETKKFNIREVLKSIDFTKSYTFIEFEFLLENEVVKAMAEISLAVDILGKEFLKEFLGNQQVVLTIAEHLDIPYFGNIQNPDLSFADVQFMKQVANENNIKIDYSTIIDDNNNLVCLSINDFINDLETWVIAAIKSNYEQGDMLYPIKFNNTIYSSDGLRFGILDTIAEYCKLKNV